MAAGLPFWSRGRTESEEGWSGGNGRRGESRSLLVDQRNVRSSSSASGGGSPRSRLLLSSRASVGHRPAMAKGELGQTIQTEGKKAKAGGGKEATVGGQFLNTKRATTTQPRKMTWSLRSEMYCNKFYNNHLLDRNNRHIAMAGTGSRRLCRLFGLIALRQTS